MKSINQNNASHQDMRFPLMVIFCLALVALLCSFSTGISGNDFWWHVKVGQWIAENGKVPAVDVFSWYGTANQVPWIAHEWLSDVILYWVFSCFGTVGIFVMSVSAAVGMLILLWKQAEKHLAQNILVSGLFFALFSVTTSIFFYGRPHLFSFFLLFWELKLLFRFWEDPRSKGIFLVPVIACLWSNLHGGSSSLAYLLCIMFFVIGLLKIKIGCIESQRLEKRAAIKLAVVTALSALAIVINPFGLKMLLYPFANMGDKLMLAIIQEWHAPDAKDTGDLILFYIPIALMLMGFFARDAKIRLIDVAAMGVFVFLFLRSVRFIMLWYIAAPFCAFTYLPQCKIKPFGNRTKTLLTVICVIVLILPAGAIIGNVMEASQEQKLITTVMSQEAVDAVKEDAPERLFNDYNLGEALIYHDIPVFFDARADVYAYENLLGDGVSLMLLEQMNVNADTAHVDVEALLKKYDFDAILILRNRALYAYLVSHPEAFTCVYEDDMLGYFRLISK